MAEGSGHADRLRPRRSSGRRAPARTSRPPASRPGLRRIDLAYQMGVTEETIRLWEKGSVQPSVERLARLIALMALETDGVAGPQRARRRPSSARAAPAPASARPVALTQAEVVRILESRRPPTPAGRPGAPRLAPTSSTAWPSSSGSPSRTSPPCAPRRSWSTPPAGPPSASSSGLAARSSGSPAARSPRRSGVSQGTVVAWELGYRVPGSTQLPRLAAATLGRHRLPGRRPCPVGSRPPRLGELILARQRELGLRSADVAQLTRHHRGHGQPLGQRTQPPGAAEPPPPRGGPEGPLRQHHRSRRSGGMTRSGAHQMAGSHT